MLDKFGQPHILDRDRSNDKCFPNIFLLDLNSGTSKTSIASGIIMGGRGE
jgi:hypothetical protein